MFGIKHIVLASALVMMTLGASAALVNHLTFDDTNDLLKATVGTDAVSYKAKFVQMEGLGNITLCTDAAATNSLAAKSYAITIPKGNFLSLTHGVATSGTKPYCLVMRLWFQSGGTFNSIYSLNQSNTSDGYCFLQGTGLGGGTGSWSGYAGSFTHQTWHTLVFSVTDGKATPYIDDMTTPTRSTSGAVHALDDRPKILLFADNDGEDATFYLDEVWVYDEARPKAVFSSTYAVEICPSPHGSATGAGTYDEDETATLTATPDAGYAFSYWAGGNLTLTTAQRAQNPLVISGAMQLTPIFVPKNPGYDFGALVNHLTFDDTDDPLKATVGPDGISYDNTYTMREGLGNITICEDVAATAGLAQGSSAIKIPVNSFLRVRQGIVPSGTKPWCLVMRCWRQQDAGGYFGFYSLAHLNSNDSYAFVWKGDLGGATGGWSGYQGYVSDKEWHTMIFSSSNGCVTPYMDNTVTRLRTPSGAVHNLDGEAELLINADDGGEDGVMYLDEMWLYDSARPAAVFYPDSIYVTATPAERGTPSSGYGHSATCTNGIAYTFSFPESFTEETVRGWCRGWTMTQWDGTVTSGTGCSRSIVYGQAYENATLTWQLDLDYKVAFGAAEGGTATTDATWYRHGTAATVTATPAAGYAFSHWTGDGVTDANKYQNPLTLANVSAPMTLTPVFVLPKRVVATAAEATGDWADAAVAGDNAYGIFTSVLSSAGAGGTVLVKPGTYVLTNQISLLSGTHNGVTLKSDDGEGNLARKTTLLVGGYPATTNRLVYITAPYATVDGFTLKNGYVDATCGGAVWLNNATGASVRNCDFLGNTAWWKAQESASFSPGDSRTEAAGGGLFIEGAGIVSNCLFRGNKAFSGAGVQSKSSLQVVSPAASVPYVTRCSFVENSNYGPGNNGPKYGSGNGLCSYGSVVVDYSSFISNKVANARGMVLACSCTEGGTVSNCLFEANQGSHTKSYSVNCVVSATSLISCTALRESYVPFNGSEWDGHTICDCTYEPAQASRTLRNCLFVNQKNTSGLLLTGSEGQNGFVDNCTFIGNSSCFRSTTSAVKTNFINNCVFYGNSTIHTATADFNCSAAYYVMSNCVWQGTFSNRSAALPTPITSGCRTDLALADAKFIDADAGNYRLQRKSPLRDAALTLDWMSGATDLDGRPRCIDKRGKATADALPDIGSFECEIAPRGLVLLVK